MEKFLELNEEELENVTGGNVIITLTANVIYAGILIGVGAGLLKFKQWISKKRKKKKARKIKEILKVAQVIKDNSTVSKNSWFW